MFIKLDNDEGIKLTIAKYYLPSGRTIQAVGIQPDVVVYPGNVPENDNNFSLKEADLKRHLKGELEKIQEKAPLDSKNTTKNANFTQEDIYKDIQLKTAIDILKAWNIFKPKQ